MRAITQSIRESNNRLAAVVMEELRSSKLEQDATLRAHMTQLNEMAGASRAEDEKRAEKMAHFMDTLQVFNNQLSEQMSKIMEDGGKGAQPSPPHRATGSLETPVEETKKGLKGSLVLRGLGPALGFHAKEHHSLADGQMMTA